MTFNPRTNPTDKQAKQMADSLEAAIALFGTSGLAHLCNVKPSAVRVWRKRGRISATAANALSKTEYGVFYGFTREEMRPDVMVWYIDGKEAK